MGIDKVAKPEEEGIKNPRIKKTKIIAIAKTSFGTPSNNLDKPYKILSLIFPSSKVKYIPRHMPIIRHTPTISPAPLVKREIALS